MHPEDLANLVAALLALLPAMAIGAGLGGWLRRRRQRHAGVVTQTGGSAMCNHCPAYVTGLRRWEARAWARGHTAQYHPDHPATAIR